MRLIKNGKTIEIENQANRIHAHLKTALLPALIPIPQLQPLILIQPLSNNLIPLPSAPILPNPIQIPNQSISSIAFEFID
jgi:hypothetical protein